MITLIVMLIVFLIGLAIFGFGFLACLLSLWANFRQSDYDYVASRKDPKTKAKKSPSKKSPFKPAKNIKTKR